MFLKSNISWTQEHNSSNLDNKKPSEGRALKSAAQRIMSKQDVEKVSSLQCVSSDVVPEYSCISLVYATA
jgi:hypothetical protein